MTICAYLTSPVKIFFQDNRFISTCSSFQASFKMPVKSGKCMILLIILKTVCVIQFVPNPEYKKCFP